MIFIKAENILFNEKDLEKAILNKTHKPKTKYKISIRNGYPSLCIGHEHYYVHRLLGEVYFENIEGFLIHHIDGNKNNASRENLIKISSSEHCTLHHKGKDFRSCEGMMNSVMAMADKRRRDDISVDEVKKLRDKGFTYKELGIRFKCGQSTIGRCLQCTKESDTE